jgi:ATP-dependent Clp protease ATP-binding subunit ClpA
MAVAALAEEVEALFQGARRVARRTGHAQVDAVHVFLAALEPPPDELRGALAAARVGLVLLRDRLERRLADLPRGVPAEDAVELADSVRPLLRVAGERAARRGDGPVRTVDVIDALLAARSPRRCARPAPTSPRSSARSRCARGPTRTRRLASSPSTPSI